MQSLQTMHQHHSPSHLSSSHHSRGSIQRTGTAQEQGLGPDISLLSPILQRQWDHAKNAHLGMILIKPHTHRKVWWSCDQCPLGYSHEWEAHVDHRFSGTSCPFCNNNRVCQHNSLATKHPDIVAEFSPRNQGTAHDYTAGSGDKVVWQCKHGQEYLASLYSRTTNKTGCPECFAIRQSSQPRQRHPVLADSPYPVMHLWDAELNAKEALNPNKLRCRSNKVCNWVCYCCPRGQPHKWRAASSVCSGSGCPCCCGHKACICNSLQSLFPEVAAEWDYTRNPGTPDDYAAGSVSRAWWFNDKRGNFQSTIHSQTASGRKASRASRLVVSDVQTHCRISYNFCTVSANADRVITLWQHPRLLSGQMLHLLSYVGDVQLLVHQL